MARTTQLPDANVRLKLKHFLTGDRVFHIAAAGLGMDALPKFLLFNASAAKPARSGSRTIVNTDADTDDGSDAGSASDIDFHADLPTVSSHDAVAVHSWLLGIASHRSTQPCSRPEVLIRWLVELPSCIVPVQCQARV